MSELKEIWRDVPGWKGLYLVSNTGKVASIRKGQHREMTRTMQTKGYLMVTFYRNGETTRYLVHRLVASAFLDNPDNLPQVNHKDENKTNNAVDNLEWCDNKYNCNYGSCGKKHRDALRQMVVGLRADADPVVWETIAECGETLGIGMKKLSEVLDYNECIDKPTAITKDRMGILWRLMRVSCEYDDNFNIVYESMRERKRKALIASNKPMPKTTVGIGEKIKVELPPTDGELLPMNEQG